MTLTVEVQLAVDGASVPSRQEFSAWARAAWRDDAQDAEVVVRVTDEAESRRLNHDYRGADKATNVLSFGFDPLPGMEFHHIGDVVICAPVVCREANEQNKSADAHFAHMVIHGALHLLGYDHENDTDAAKMEAKERHILELLGFPDPYVLDHGR